MSSVVPGGGAAAQQWHIVTQAVGLVDHALQHDTERRGLPATWFTTLTLLLDAPGHTMAMTPLAAELDITSGGLTKLVDRLHNAGLVVRRTDPADRRLVLAALTDLGRRTAEEAVRHREELLRLLVVGVLPPGELAATARALAAVAAAVRSRAVG